MQPIEYLFLPKADYELTGNEEEIGANGRFDFDVISSEIDKAIDLKYEEVTGGSLQKRLIERARTLYRKDDLTAALPLKMFQSFGPTFESYRLAFTPGLIEKVYDMCVSSTMLADEGKYFRFNGEAEWWIPSGRIFFYPDPFVFVPESFNCSPEELRWAKDHFFLAHRFVDPFGHRTK